MALNPAFTEVSKESEVKKERKRRGLMAAIFTILLPVKETVPSCKTYIIHFSV